MFSVFQSRMVDLSATKAEVMQGEEPKGFAQKLCFCDVYGKVSESLAKNSWLVLGVCLITYYIYTSYFKDWSAR
jgi:hypothetical protein